MPTFSWMEGTTEHGWIMLSVARGDVARATLCRQPSRVKTLLGYAVLGVWSFVALLATSLFECLFVRQRSVTLTIAVAGVFAARVVLVALWAVSCFIVCFALTVVGLP